jgi:hypothetical protein
VGGALAEQQRALETLRQRQLAALALAHWHATRHRAFLSGAWQTLRAAAALRRAVRRSEAASAGRRAAEQSGMRRWMHRRVVALALRGAVARSFQTWLGVCTRRRRRVAAAQKQAAHSARSARGAAARAFGRWRLACAQQAATEAEAALAASSRTVRFFFSRTTLRGQI